MATVSYTYDLKCNGGNVSQVKINGTDVKRLKVNGKDVIHKFVTYQTTAIIYVWMHISELRAGPAYTSCGDYYSDVDGKGYFFVSSSTSGDSLSDSGGSIPNVEVYFRRCFILGRQNNHHDTFSNLDPNKLQTFNNFSSFATAFIDSYDADEPFRLSAFKDYYSDGSELKTSWGNVNISAEKYTPYLTQGTSTAADIVLGSISKTFTRTVQEY